MDATLLPALHGIVRRVLVQLGEAREVEAGVDERLEVCLRLDRQQADVDQLNRLLADHVGADQLHVVGAVDELQKAGVVADDAAVRIVPVARPPDPVGDALRCAESSVSPTMEPPGVV